MFGRARAPRYALHTRFCGSRSSITICKKVHHASSGTVVPNATAVGTTPQDSCQECWLRDVADPVWPGVRVCARARLASGSTARSTASCHLERGSLMSRTLLLPTPRSPFCRRFRFSPPSRPTMPTVTTTVTSSTGAATNTTTTTVASPDPEEPCLAHNDPQLAASIFPSGNKNEVGTARPNFCRGRSAVVAPPAALARAPLVPPPPPPPPPTTHHHLRAGTMSS